MSERRVAITGAGPVSAIGTGREMFFAALADGESGVAPLTLFDVEGVTAAEIADFNVEDYLETPKTYLDRSSEFAFAAASLAIEDAGLDVDNIDRPRTGLTLGSAYGSLGTMELFFRDVLDKGPKFAKPFLFPHTYPNTAISLLAIEYGLTGPHLNFAAGHVSAANAVIAGYDMIRAGQADMVLAGGYESLSEALLKAYTLADAPDPGDGIAIGEGAGIVVLEELEHANAREVHIYAELAGAALGSRAGEMKPGQAVTIDVRRMIGETMGAGAALHVIAALKRIEDGADSALVKSLDPGGATAAILLRGQSPFPASPTP